MRIIYAIVLAVVCCPFLNAQIEFAPLEGNPILRTEAAKEKVAFLDEYEKMISVEKVNCPPNIFFQNSVVAGSDTTFIRIDTVGTTIGGDTIDFTEILDCSNISNGFAEGFNPEVTTLAAFIRYAPNADVLVGFDTLCVRVCNFENICDTIYTPIFIKRAGQSYDVAGPNLNPYDTEDNFCVDEGVLEGEIACAEVLECADTYDGEGQQSVYLASFGDVTPCIFYEASGFPGEDLVCLIICDEYTICDTFNITYTIAGETLELPFFEDFSNNNNGPYPSTDFWLDRDAYINNTMAPNPPSIGMATMDGLDRTGSPYGTNGLGDHLTSKQINLGGLTGNDNVYFKCYVAPRGYGLYPNGADSLVLEFRNVDREWERATSWQGIDTIPASLDLLPFEFKSVAITEDAYLHDAFQFRFKSYHTPGGLDDLWHIDYLLLEANTTSDSIYEDVAFSDIPRAVLESYTAMPWKHLKINLSNEVSSANIDSEFFSSSLQTNAIEASEVSLVDLISGQTIPATSTVVDALNIAPFEHTPFSKTAGGFWTDVANGLSSFADDTEKMELALGYSLTVASQDNPALRNDQTTFITHIDDYFAYDDGSAERTVFLVNSQNENPELCLRYHANVNDSLRAVRIQFPHLNNIDNSNQIFNIKVWVDENASGSVDFLNNNDPVYVREFVEPVYPDLTRDTLQGFTTYSIEDELGVHTPIAIPAGADFYIGFQQVSITDEGIPIGFDLQYDARQHTFVRLGANWTPISDNFNGAIIYRPILGSTDPGNTATDDFEELENNPVRIYPNPSSGMVNVSIEKGNYQDYEVHIYNNIGQKIQIKKMNNMLNLSDLQNGLYHLEFVNKNSHSSYFRKVVISN